MENIFDGLSIHKNFILKRVFYIIKFGGKRYYSSVQPTSAVRVRFAPSPTGYLHLGGLRTALFNFLLARKTGGTFILRIEDTDRTRYVPGAVEKLISTLKWVGLRPGMTTFYGSCYQSERTEIYKEYVNKLLKDGNAYRCFCTSERLQNMRLMAQKVGKGVAYDRHCSYLSQSEIEQNISQGIPFTIRLKTPDSAVTVKDLIRGKVEFDKNHIDDTILLKSDGYPTYHLANVIDDHLMKITHVLRGEEWLPSTPKHMILYQSLGWDIPKFVHLPLLLNINKSKLSKRTGDSHVEEFAKLGYLPEALINFVALLGWSSPYERKDEIFTLNELISEFSINNLGHSNSIVSIEKLNFLNKQHLLLKSKSPEGLSQLTASLRELVNEKFRERLEDEYLALVIKTILQRMHNLSDIPELCKYFFVDPDYSSSESIHLRSLFTDDALKKVATIAYEQFRKLENFEYHDDEKIKKTIKDICNSSKIKQSEVMMILRYIFTGIKVGAGIAETIKAIGKKTSVERLNKILASFDSLNSNDDSNTLNTKDNESIEENDTLKIKQSNL
ncbi:9568_t:CDS:10 [Diversispora eburnea]|uniref:Glutamate--tRNA ligase, mitochondrial n=1 Tax=Diversispora eburnea TaxID=1213867 RepID=A0A9N8YM50_9GLOM|nr:9568_t:CDS:10 [Diversispora eburnea]